LKDEIKLLAQLQECDNRIRDILSRKEIGPRRLQELMDEMKANDLKLQELADQQDLSKKERRKIEQEVQELDSRIEKSHVKLSNIKSNKEYAAALKEIEDLKKLKFDTEDKIIHVMEKIEETEKEIGGQIQAVQDLKAKSDKTRKEVEKELLLLDRDLKGLEQNRDDLVQVLDQDLWKRYLFLKERRGGLAVTSVIGGVCQTCHMGLPPQKFNELLKGDAIMSCPYCHRIIYWGEDKDFQSPQEAL
jgi:predicted  nucleic acid-binding Zn-ribbon protein